MDGELSPRSAELVELRSQLDAARAEKDNALAETAELRAAAAAPATETAVPDPAAPGPSGQQDSTEARIVAAVAAALRGQFSSNSSTNRFNAAVAAMGPEKFSPQGKQTLENWLRSVRLAFRYSQLEEASWGSALVMCLDSNSRSAVYAQFAQQDLQEDFSSDAVIEVLTQFYGAKETHSNQLQRLSLHSVTMQAFQQYRDKFTEVSTHVSDGQMTAIGRCRLVTRVLPESLRLALTLGNRGEFTDVGELFEKARIGIQVLQAQSDAFSFYAQATSAPSTQRARKAKRTDSSGSEDSQRPRKQPRGDQPSRLGNRPSSGTGQVGGHCPCLGPGWEVRQL